MAGRWPSSRATTDASAWSRHDKDDPGVDVPAVRIWHASANAIQGFAVRNEAAAFLVAVLLPVLLGLTAGPGGEAAWHLRQRWSTYGLGASPEAWSASKGGRLR
ncbi:hypothetical protein B1R27_00600 [Streptomyces sp. GKU 895]|nr:hypothetical protein B1R27_00600 [Streptomyces sp. GKU 895]